MKTPTPNLHELISLASISAVPHTVVIAGGVCSVSALNKAKNYSFSSFFDVTMLSFKCSADFHVQHVKRRDLQTIDKLD